MSRDKSSSRTYNAQRRQQQSEQSKLRIMQFAKKLFAKQGFTSVTIEAIAVAAGVSVPTVYAKFKSKQGILHAVIDSALSSEQHDALVSAVYASDSAQEQLHIAAKLSRQLYDAEYQQMDWLRGAAVIDPIFKQLEQEREARRYQRQLATVQMMSEKGAFAPTLSLTQARDILWAFTGRSFYRMLVLERGWSSNRYEQWLADMLIKALLV